MSVIFWEDAKEHTILTDALISSAGMFFPEETLITASEGTTVLQTGDKSILYSQGAHIPALDIIMITRNEKINFGFLIVSYITETRKFHSKNQCLKYPFSLIFNLLTDK